MDVEAVADHMVTSAADTGLLLDFDGVLAPIIDDPAASQLFPGTDAILSELADSLRLVAVISGRPVAFLQGRISALGVELIGSYGAEVLREGAPSAIGDVAKFLPAVGQAEALLREAAGNHVGLLVEAKSVSVAVHWRNAPDRITAERFVRDLTSTVATQTGLLPEPGKFVIELRPPTRVDKGRTVERLIEQHALKVPVYVGDDLGDLPALYTVAQAGGHALLVDHGAETDDSLRKAAGASFNGVEQLQDWLQALVVRLRRA